MTHRPVVPKGFQGDPHTEPSKCAKCRKPWYSAVHDNLPSLVPAPVPDDIAILAELVESIAVRCWPDLGTTESVRIAATAREIIMRRSPF